jgi:tetratricopeptide (TPR) repeat protein
MIPLVIADARRPLKIKNNALRLASDLQFFTRALSLDENDIAAAQLERMCIQLDPSNVEYKALLADSLARGGQAAEASKIFSTFTLADDTDPMVIKMLALHFIRTSDPHRAQVLIERFAKREDIKNDPRFLIIKARVWLRSGFNKRAIALFQDAADHADTAYCKELWQAIVCNLRSEPVETIKHLEAAGKILPDDPVWHTDMSSELAHSDLQASREHILAALASKRLYCRALIMNSNYLQSHGFYEHAQNCLDYYARLRPTSAELHFAKARLAKAQGNLKGACSEYARGLELNPRYAQSYIEQAHIYQDMKQPEKAASILQQVTIQCPNFLQGWLRYGESLEQQGATLKAEAAYLQGLTLVPARIEEANIIIKNEVGDLHANLATILYNEGKRSEAVAEATKFNHFKIVLDLPAAMRMLNLRPGRLTEKVSLKDETRVRESVLLADALFECKDYKDSAVEYRKAIAIDGGDPDLHSYLMNALTEAGDWTSAAGEDFHLSDSLVRQMTKKFGSFFQPAEDKPSSK